MNITALLKPAPMSAVAVKDMTTPIMVPANMAPQMLPQASRGHDENTTKDKNAPLIEYENYCIYPVHRTEHSAASS
jgi:hypothetical protein